MPKGSAKTNARRSKRPLDFGLWVRKAYWSSLEAAALSFSEDPDALLALPPGELSRLMEFPNLHHRLDEIERVQKTRNRPNGLSPNEFLEWALSMEIALPGALRAAIERVGATQSDWRRKFESERAQVEALQRQLDENRMTITELKKHEREDRRRSLQKLVVGIAIAKYGYVLGKRTDTARKIAADLQHVHDEHATDGPPLSQIGLDEDTIRSHLANAGRELSSD